MRASYVRVLARRFSRGPGRWTTALGLAVGALIATTATLMMVAVPQSGSREVAVTPTRVIGEDATFTWDVVHSQWRSRSVTVVRVHREGSADPVLPPGVPAWPEPGQAYVSPALAAAIKADPTLAGRVDAEVVGIIADAGLISPDAVQAVVGTSSDEMLAASGWGPTSADSPDALPVTSVRLVVLLLALLPCLALTGTVATLLTAALRPRLAWMALAGASRHDLVRVSRAVAVRVGAMPTLLGVLAGVGAVALLGPTGALGVASFVPALAVLAAAAVGVVLAQVGVLAAAAGVAAWIGGRRPLTARSGPRLRRTGRWAVVAAGAFGMIAIPVVMRWSTATDRAPTTSLLVIFLGAALVLLTTVGAIAATLIRAGVRRLPPDTPAPTLVAWRRLAHDPVPVVAQAISFALLATVFVVMGAVQLMLAQQSGPGAWWTASLVSATPDQAMRAVTGVPPGAVLIHDDDGAETTWGTCVALTSVFGPLRTVQGDPCVDGTTYGAATLGAQSPTDPGLLVPLTWVGDSRDVVTVDPAGLSASALGTSDGAFSLTWRAADLDAEQSAVLAEAPSSAFTAVVGDARTLVLVPRLRAVTEVALVLGAAAVLASILLAVGSGGGAGRGVRDLRLIGASRRDLVAVAVRQAAIGSVAAALAALVVALTIGQAYLSLGSLYAVDPGTALTAAGLLAGVAAASTGAAGWRAWLRESPG